MTNGKPRRLSRGFFIVGCLWFYRFQIRQADLEWQDGRCYSIWIGACSIRLQFIKIIS